MKGENSPKQAASVSSPHRAWGPTQSNFPTSPGSKEWVIPGIPLPSALMESPKDVERKSPWRPGQQRGKEESAEGERGNSPRVQEEYKSPCSYVWGGACPCYLPCHHHPKAGLKSLHQNYSSISTFQVCPTNPITTHQHSDSSWCLDQSISNVCVLRRNDLRTGAC